MPSRKAPANALNPLGGQPAVKPATAGKAPARAGDTVALRRFMAPGKGFAGIGAEAAGALVAAASDVALVLDASGIVRDLSAGSEELARDWGADWIGRPWIDTVTTESRAKIQALLDDAAAGIEPRWRHVNHPRPPGADVPVQYIALPLGGDGRILAVGRDLRATAAMQQRLVEAQQSMERDYARLRHVEMRYRLLFQTTPEAVLIVDASAQKVVEANPAGAALLGDPGGRAAGRPLLEAFDPVGAEAVQMLLAGVRATGRPDEAHAFSSDGTGEFRVSASLFRQDGASLFLVRMAPVEPSGATAAPLEAANPLRLVQALPDAFVLTDAEGRILDANPAFLDLAQLATAEQVRNESLDRWLGRPGVDLSVLIATLRQHGSVRLYATTLRGEYGAMAEIEVCAGLVPEGPAQRLGFSIRSVGRRLAADTGRRELPRAVEQLTELVGRVPLKDLVRETTDVIERLCIEAALEITGDNRASAAEILGLSRQSLYVKLRRYGLGDLDGDDGTE